MASTGDLALKGVYTMSFRLKGGGARMLRRRLSIRVDSREKSGGVHEVAPTHPIRPYRAKRKGSVAMAVSISLAALMISQMIPGPAGAVPIGGYNVVGSILNEYNRLVGIGKSPGNPLANEPGLFTGVAGIWVS